MSIADLERDLAGLGMTIATEARGRVAVITPAAPVHLDAANRRRIVALAREHGFSNACLELPLDDAHLPGDQPAR